MSPLQSLLLSYSLFRLEQEERAFLWTWSVLMRNTVPDNHLFYMVLN